MNILEAEKKLILKRIRKTENRIKAIERFTATTLYKNKLGNELILLKQLKLKLRDITKKETEKVVFT